MCSPIWDQTISVRAPMNCGVALMPSFMVSSSTIFPMESQSTDFSRWLWSQLRLSNGFMATYLLKADLLILLHGATC